MIKSNQNAWLEPYIDMNKQQVILKDFFQLMNNAIFEKTMKNVKNLGRQKKKKEEKTD